MTNTHRLLITHDMNNNNFIILLGSAVEMQSARDILRNYASFCRLVQQQRRVRTAVSVGGRRDARRKLMSGATRIGRRMLQQSNGRAHTFTKGLCFVSMQTACWLASTNGIVSVLS